MLDWLAILSVPALVLLNGFFVAAEFSLVAVRRTQVEEMVRQGLRGSHSLHKQVVHLDHAIAATQLGITIASIALGWISEQVLVRRLEPLFAGLAVGWQGAAAHTVAFVIAFLLVTFMHVVLGELAPKAMALQRPALVALNVAIPLEVFTRLSRPIVLLMNGVGNAIVRLLGFQSVTAREMVHSVEELTMLVEEVEEAGLLSSDQAAFVHNVFRLSGKTVADCMVPRERMAALELRTPPDRVLEAVREGAHTRMPVYEGELDQVVGVVNTKDLFHLYSLQGVVILEDAIYPATFLKPEENIAEAFQLFKKTRRPMAVVRSEAGKVVGLLTLEDILEEIVGDIEDEHDAPVKTVRRAYLRQIPSRPKTNASARKK